MEITEAREMQGRDQDGPAWDGSRDWPAASVLPPLGALPTAPAAARVHVRTTLAVWGLSYLTEAAETVISELVANGANASADDAGKPGYRDGHLLMVRVCLFTDGLRVRAEVWDQAAGAPVRKSAGTDDESGRGLELVDALAAQWGWHPAVGQPGKCVWAEFLTSIEVTR